MGVGSGLLELIFTGVGALPETFEGQPVRIVHGLSSKLLIASVLLHMAAALYHQFVLRDGIFRRISLFR
jgi:cytochrome b561